MAEKENKGPNIQNVKSLYILTNIFSFLCENKKLDLISYNKRLQFKLLVGLENYRKACKRTIVGKKNGKGKEYEINTDILIFEGEYQKWKRNGKGKEYYENNALKFEGEYLNGKKVSGKGYDLEGNNILIIENGKGKEYYNNGVIQFEGEYYNGRRWKGKGYDFKGNEEFVVKYGKAKENYMIFMEI